MLRINTLGIVLLAIFAFISANTQPRSGVSLDSSDCGYKDDIPAVEDYERLISFSDPYLGNFSADVTVVEYFDPNCPHCKTMHPIMQEVIAQNSDGARFYMIPFVLYQYSLPQVEALYVAAQEDKYHTMLDLQYKYQQSGGLGLDQLGDIAAEIGMDRDTFIRRVQQGLNQRRIIARREEIRKLGITGTPSVMINGRFVANDSKSTKCLNALIREAAASARAEKEDSTSDGDSSGRRE